MILHSRPLTYLRIGMASFLHCGCELACNSEETEKDHVSPMRPRWTYPQWIIFLNHIHVVLLIAISNYSIHGA